MMLNTTPGPDCESLCTVTESDKYHTDRGNVAAWVTLETTRKEELLRTAYDYLIGVYGPVWPAGQVFGTMADTPDVIMRGARNACAQLALYAKDGPLDAEVAPQVTEQTVGPITTKYASKPATVARRTFPDVGRMMAPYLAASNPYMTPMRRA